MINIIKTDPSFEIKLLIVDDIIKYNIILS